MSVPDVVNALAPVVAELERLGVRYYLGGSVASSTYGAARTTLDADLVAELWPEHAAPLRAALEKDFYVSHPMIASAIAQRSCFNVIHLASMFKVDVFVSKDREFDRTVMARSHRDTIGEAGASVELCIASVEDVILNKLCWYQLGDEVSERQWQDVLAVLRVQGERLDHTHLAHWAAELSVSELLAKAFAEAGHK